MRMVTVFKATYNPVEKRSETKPIGKFRFHGYGIDWKTIPSGQVVQVTAAICEDLRDGAVRLVDLHLVKFNPLTAEAS